MINTSYKVNDAAIVAELFDNEAIIMDLSDGVYYTLSGTAAEVWSMIEAGLTRDDIVARLSSLHDVDAATCNSDLEPFFAELVERSIVLSSTEAPTSKGEVAEGAFGAYTAPTVICHTDMAEVMAMDPPLPELTAAGKTAD